ncbi:YbaB/EbfC family nucleoid-associated protein [Anaerococcus hydrogenalis]|uniref:Nucleoid-associated protein HMPREF9246_0775 n=3 Tax=Anaerococcus hydrogenalis TaxID=33029 RepID=F0GZU3_9FIRM|nr:YbaB/EbfC family nucleoid-associated protein [Anaerococcus hydrogenalis]EEB36039.1 DNA-binding protein, YbaB/EbfC family [Anaerococcus hydrogenalis DSM 7454]EGC84571.1 DNA-binding protein, YbaB/EbfC family [Anaerococcus hydrogenalis ACS-025-V-Sch4]MDK7694666.1 YbaB/EbfC family nucleoid-associated protein [Anaerococcus hydrogenalis]MDK7696444.1 YbaB/EbfC family nucleoid-associated protein [Anaerococcus hydrogenalis]MDK7707693.1 YbaB/EbfC family nucleoid-associated protein [Anaerococcus hydro
MARGGFPGGGNMNNMMKKVKKMQEDMAKAQQEIEEKEFSSTAGGGVIEAVVNGKKEVIKIKIDEDVVDPEDTEMLEDLVVAAVNDALKKADQYTQKEMGKLTGNINIPGLM